MQVVGDESSRVRHRGCFVFPTPNFCGVAALASTRIRAYQLAFQWADITFSISRVETPSNPTIAALGEPRTHTR